MLECIQCIGLALKAWPNRIAQLPTTPSGWEVSHNGESWTCEPSWVMNIDGSDWLHPISTLSFLYNPSGPLLIWEFCCSYNIYPHNLETWMIFILKKAKTIVCSFKPGFFKGFCDAPKVMIIQKNKLAKSGLNIRYESRNKTESLYIIAYLLELIINI